tara:strand:+ start:377643 stop:378374 length:732 start_codon:yes stop_codon:yes gene_type:complete
MHKKLEAELVSLAHRILQMKNRDEVIALRDRAREVYEKLAVLAFVDDYIATTPNLESSKEELLQKIGQLTTTEKEASKTNLSQLKVESEKSQPVVKESVKEERSTSKDQENIFEPKFDSVRIDIQSLKSNQVSSKEEFRDAISADKTAHLFDDDDLETKEKKTLNDKLVHHKFQVGLNDRIAFVNHLFNFNQAEFNNALSELNTFKTEKEAKAFIANKIKPKYNWEGKETYEERLIALIERKF